MKADEMQRLRSQALTAFDNADYTAAITFLDKILEVSFLGAAADDHSDCVRHCDTFIHYQN